MANIKQDLVKNMKRWSARTFINKHISIEEGEYKVHKVYVFWVIPIYKYITIIN